MGLVFNHFRRHVLERAAKGVSLLIEFLLDAPSEVADLEHVFIAHQKVLRLEVSVNKAVFVQKVDTSNSLHKKVESLVFGQQALLVSIPYDVE